MPWPLLNICWAGVIAILKFYVSDIASYVTLSLCMLTGYYEIILHGPIISAGTIDQIDQTWPLMNQLYDCALCMHFSQRKNRLP